MRKGPGDIRRGIHGPCGFSVSLFPPACSLERRWRLARSWRWPCRGASSWTRRGAAGTRSSAPAATARRRPRHAAPRTPSPPKVRRSPGFPHGLPERWQVRKGVPSLPGGGRRMNTAAAPAGTPASGPRERSGELTCGHQAATISGDRPVSFSRFSPSGCRVAPSASSGAADENLATCLVALCAERPRLRGAAGPRSSASPIHAYGRAYSHLHFTRGAARPRAWPPQLTSSAGV